MRLERGDVLRAFRVDGEPDAVAHVEAGGLPRILHDPDHVAREPLGLELGSEHRVEHDEAARRQGRDRRTLLIRDEGQLVLAVLQLLAGHRHERLGAPVPRLRLADELLHASADARAERTRVHA